MLYSFLLIFFRRFWHIFDFTLGHPERVPADGPVIFAANHQSFWDVPLLATYVDRPVSFMAKEELFKVPIFGSIIRNLHAFPVRRGASDKTAIKTALGILKSGECMAIFPEGTRSKDGKLGKVGAGVSLLASMSKATVVPVAIVGTRKIFGKKFLPKVAVLYGEPMRFDAEHADKQALNDFSEKLMERIREMLEAYERGEVV